MIICREPSPYARLRWACSLLLCTLALAGNAHAVRAQDTQSSQNANASDEQQPPSSEPAGRPPSPSEFEVPEEVIPDMGDEALRRVEEAVRQAGENKMPADIVGAPEDQSSEQIPLDPVAVDSPPTAAHNAGVASPADSYGYWTLLPPLVAIILAVITRQVVPALVVAVLVGAYMLLFAPPAALPGDMVEGSKIIGGVRLAMEHYFIGAVSDVSRMRIMVFTLLIGATIGIIGANGGTRAMVQGVSGWASTRARGQVMGWFAGLLVFFDDYANTMIVGPTMRPIFDKLRISRQKLAYIVDSTAAPVASIALIGTWIGVEVGFIGNGLQLFETRPAFLEGVTAYNAFLYSVPYRFYAIFALFLVFIIAVTGRDFGPMKHAERRAAAGSAPELAAEQRTASAMPTVVGKWWYGGIPVLVLLFVTVALLFLTGWYGRPDNFADLNLGDKASKLLENAKGEHSILYGSALAVFSAVMISSLTRTLPLSRTVEAAQDGMCRMFTAIVVLALAWTLTGVMKDLELARVAESMLRESAFNPKYLPMSIFLLSAIVSFATGTSWGTMGILCPVVVAVAGGLIADAPDLSNDQSLRLFYGSVGSVLAGSIFGDHCSPISDTTVLSATASGCSLESHVWTQIFYALVGAVVAIGCGDLMCMHYDKPAWMGLILGCVVLVVVVLLFGRKAGIVSAPDPVDPVSS